MNDELVKTRSLLRLIPISIDINVFLLGQCDWLLWQETVYQMFMAIYSNVLSDYMKNKTRTNRFCAHLECILSYMGWTYF